MAPITTAIGTSTLRDDCGVACGGGTAGGAAATAGCADDASITVASACVPLPTAAADAGRWGREIGAQAVLAKPFELDELIRAVEQLWQPRPRPEI